jgi:cytochrome c-type biogenesis protein CcmH
MADQTAKPLPLARIALIIAALVAAVAIGLAIWKQRAPVSAPTSATAQSEAPDVETMISGLEAKLKDNPKDADGWRMLGWAFFESGKYAESASAYARATQIDPAKGEYWSSLGEARVLAGKGDVPADAKAAFEKALSVDPKDPRARYFLAVAKDIGGDHKGAIDDWFALLADTPAGAPWEGDVRRIITEVSTKEKIDVSARLAALRPAPATGGASVATAGIPGPTNSQMRSASQLPKGQQDAMISGMVDGLDAKLKANPKNESGWIMLMRSRQQLGETGKAAAAYQSAKASFAGDAASLGRLKAAADELGIKG